MSDRGGVLECDAHDLRRVDDAGAQHVAGLMITTEAMVAEHLPGGGGMGGMIG